jgi:hypothetical protein
MAHKALAQVEPAPRGLPIELDDGSVLIMDEASSRWWRAQEVLMSDERVKTAASLVRCGQLLAVPMDDAPNRRQEYWDQVNAGGAYTDAELEPLGITKDQLTQAVTLLENVDKFFNGETPANDVYRVVVNALRHVGAQI